MLHVALVKYQPNKLLCCCFQRKLFHGIYIEKQLHVRNIVSALYEDEHLTIIVLGYLWKVQKGNGTLKTNL